MARLNRRDFLKALSLGSGAAAVSACGLDDNMYRTPIEEVLPYVVKPEQIVPGTPTFFATTVTTGPNAWPVLGNHRDGRVVNVSENKLAHVDGGIPKAAFLELQRHYSPDRFQGPRDQAGTALSWDDALAKLGEAVTKAKAEGKQIAWIGPYRSGAIVELLRDFTGDRALFWEPLGHEADATAWELLFGSKGLPNYDLSSVHYVLSFGADFLGTWGSTRMQNGFGMSRNPNIGHHIARFCAVMPHLDQTSANADDWYRCKPGTEADVAFAIAKLVANKRGYSGPGLSLVAGVDPDAAAARAGLRPPDVDAIATLFTEAAQHGAVALPGGAAGAGPQATDLALATYLINIFAGTGGRALLGNGYRGPIHRLADVKQLVADMNAGNVGVLLIDDTNPVYALPGSLGFAEALAKVGLSVGLSSHPDETNASCNLVLPTSDAFEDWGDEEPEPNRVLLRQPTMSPLWDTRSLGDILLAVGRGAGLTASATTLAPVPALPITIPAAHPNVPTAPMVEAPGLGFAPATWHDYLKARWKRDFHPPISMSRGFDEFWVDSLRNGYHVVPPSQAAKAALPPIDGSRFAYEAAAVADSAAYLHVHPHPHRYDGRYANQPWAQEVVDPLTGLAWDSWVEISPALAEKLGVTDNTLVELKTAKGTLELGAKVFAGLREDVVALAFGQGHAANGRYASGTGVNAVNLLEVVEDRFGCMVWQQGAVEVRPLGSGADFAATFGVVPGSDHDGGRNHTVAVHAETLAEHGDSHAEEPGWMTGIHEMKVDPRLVKIGSGTFYEPPEHPVYHFAMTVDTHACTGCGVCAIACYSENNLAIVGKRLMQRGREMNWLRVNRYWEGTAENPDIRWVPTMCQHCNLAPCESVCPVIATYHTLEGLNAMVYNRCVGTRYCANNCPYVVRRFNFHSYTWPEPMNLQLNPDITARTMGVMEKCTFCVQRIRRMKGAWKDAHGPLATVPDSALRKLPACAEACPSNALTFGNLNDPTSTPSKTRHSGRSYIRLAELNTRPAVNYLAKASFAITAPAPHGGGHGTADEVGATEHDGAPAVGHE